VSEAKRLSLLIGEIYDAALNPELWSGVLEQVCAYMSGCAAYIYSEDAVNKSANKYYSWGDDPEYSRLYLEKYVKMNPFSAAAFLIEVGEIKRIYDVVPYREVVETRFYKEWMRPQGQLDNIFATLDKSTTSYAAFSVIRSDRQKFFDQAARQRMILIVPHVRRSVLIGNVIDLHKTETAALTETLAGLAAGVFLVDAKGGIAFTNSAGQILLDDGHILAVAQGRLTATDPKTNRVLNDVFVASGDGDAAVGLKGIAVPLATAEGERWLANVLPLTSGARKRAGFAYAATAAVFVRKASLELPSPIEIVAKVYNLTPSEIRVLLAIVELGGLPTVAAVLGISKDTAKTHLKHVFDKTGTNRQVDLVKLIAGYANPLV
jgi:DNA-binding CsgD family transcriptional regulator